MDDKEFERIMRELDGSLPPNSKDIEEYCKVITERVLRLPPVPKDMLHLHDAIFMEDEIVPDATIVNQSEYCEPEKINYWTPFED